MSLFGYICNSFKPIDKGGFLIPEFLLERRISDYDASELRELFFQNQIEYFKDLTSEMLRSFLKYSYADAIYVIELLGLYGVKFTSEKLKHYSEPDSNDYRLLKFKRDTSEIKIDIDSEYEIESVILKRYLSDMRLSTSFLLDGIKLDVLLNRVNISENIVAKIFNYELYSEIELKNIYSPAKIKSQNIEPNVEQKTECAAVENCAVGKSKEVLLDRILLKEVSLDRILLSVRSKNALTKAGISTLGQLLKLSEIDLLCIPNLGRKSIRELHMIQKNYKEYIKKDQKVYVNKILVNQSYVQEIPSYMADIKLPQPNFSKRLSNFLVNNNIISIRKLLDFSSIELLRMSNFGRKSLNELVNYLNTINVALDTSYVIVDKESSYDEASEREDSVACEDKIQEIPSYIADIKLPQPNFSKRLSNSLVNSSITCIRDILSFSSVELLRLSNFGRKSLDELLTYLSTKNVLLDKPYVIVEKENTDNLSIKVSSLFQQIKDFENQFCKESKRKAIYDFRIGAAKKITLQTLADKFSLTRERIRQVEVSLLKILRQTIISNINVFNDLFEKYGDIISYQDIPEFEPLKNYGFAFRNVLNSSDDISFIMDPELGLLMPSNVEIDELSVEENDDIYLSRIEIESEICKKLQSYVKKSDSDLTNNFNAVLSKLTDYNIENNFLYSSDKKCYVVKNYAKSSEQLDLAFKELYPKGTYIRQRIDEIYEKITARCPTIDCSTPRALEARLTGHSKNIILTGCGFYQHIDTIHVDNDVILFAAEECKNKLRCEGHPFLISVIFEMHQKYFEQNGVFSDYLLFSLLKRLKDPALSLRRLTVYKTCDENLTMIEYFEEYFKSRKGLIPVEEVENHFHSLGWTDLRLSNYLSNSPNVFKLSIGYFYRDNVSCNIDGLKRLMDKVQEKIKECGYISLDYIREKNFVNWIDVFNHEDLDSRSMAVIIRAFYPEYPYEISNNGLISQGNKLRPYEALYQWMTQKCDEDDFVTNGEIIDFCEDNKFHRYNTKAQIRNKIVEIADDCLVTYDYLGLDENGAQKIVENIKEFFRTCDLPYLSILDLLSKLNLPEANHCKWNEYMIHSIVDNVGGISFYNFVIINPYQTKITSKDQIVANEIVNFTKSWYMETDKLERLLRRNKIFKRNETFSHKGVQNDLFGDTSCLELRDQDKNICIKADYRELWKCLNIEN